MVQKKRRYWLAGNREPEQDVFFVEALDPAIWQAGDCDNWDTCWYTGMPEPEVFAQLNGAKTVNHIPGNNGLTVKNYLFETLAAASDRVAGESDGERMAFFPRVYAMPDDYIELQQTAARHPKKRWILKPKNSSRGRGIEVIKDIATIPMNQRWLVQEYIDNPHLMKGRKYVLRLYVLITSIDPLLVYFYDEGFAKLASEPYDSNDPDNPFSNLTNPDINATNEDVAAPVEFVGLADYKKWLSSKGCDHQALFAKIRDLLVLTVISVRDKMRIRTRAIDADISGCYELLGIDCLIDDGLKPWILECNLSPSLEVCAEPGYGGKQEKRIKRQLVCDMASLIGLNEPVRERTNGKSEASICERAEREIANAGAFQRIFPGEDVEKYLPFFPVPRFADMILAKQITGRKAPRLHLMANRTVEIVSEDDLALYAENSGTLYTPNPSASWIWLKAIDGADPEEIAQELIEINGPASPEDAWKIREQVWDVLADWAALGLVRRADGRDLNAAIENDDDAPEWVGADSIRVADSALELKYGCSAVAARLRQALKPMEGAVDAEQSIAIQRAQTGYAVALGSRLIAANLGLANVAPVVCRTMFEQAPKTEREIAIGGALVPIGNGEAVFIVGLHAAGWDGLAACFANKIKAEIFGGVRLDLNGDTHGLPIGLPIRIDEEDVEEIEEALGHDIAPHIHQWSSNSKGRLLMINSQPPSTNFIIRTIVIPVRQQTGSGAMRPTSPHDALNALLPSCAGPRTHITCDAATSLNEWLTGRELLTLEFSDFAAGAAALASRYANE